MSKNLERLPASLEKEVSTEKRKPIPPIETRFKKGASGNPLGRPRKWMSYKSTMKDLLETAAPKAILKGLEPMIPVEWKRPITRAQALRLRDWVKAMSLKYGDKQSAEIWNRVEGRVPIRVSGGDGGPIETLSRISVESLSEAVLRELQQAVVVEFTEEPNDP